MTYTLNQGSPVLISYSLANTSFAGHPTLASRYPSGRRLTDVLDAYRASPEWRELAPSTQRIWVLIVNRIRERWGETPIELWSNPEQLTEIIRWRNQRAHMPRMADHQLAVFHHFLAWARLHGEVTVNLASGIPRLYRAGGRAEIIWHEDEIMRFCEGAHLQYCSASQICAHFRRSALFRFLDFPAFATITLAVS